MTAPGTAAGRFAAACLLGMGLGLWYGFLRPLRRSRPNTADLLLLPAAVWASRCAGGICARPAPWA